MSHAIAEDLRVTEEPSAVEVRTTGDERLLDVRGVALNVKCQGRGTPFIWGHGLMSSVAAEDTMGWFAWDRFPRDVRLVRYDARGHGKSQPTFRPADFHWQDLAQDMLGLADALAAPRFIAGGDSMGCATTLCAALRAPQRVQALVLVIPPTAWETRAAQGKLYRRFALAGGLLGPRLLAGMMSQSIDRMLPGWLIAAEPDKVAGVAEGMRAITRRTLWSVLRGAALCDLPPREAFAALADIPTQIIAWVGDPTHPVSSAEELHRLLPQAQLFVAQGYEEFKTIPRRIQDFVAAHA